MFSALRSTPIDRQLSKKVVKIIHTLLMKDESAAFRKPVPHKALGLQDYRLVIKKPTDLNLIRRQNNEGKYKFVEDVLDEIQLCWDNCKLYNSPDSQIYQQALFLERTFDTVGKEILPEFWQGIDREMYNKQFDLKKEEEGAKRIEEQRLKPKKDEADDKAKKKGAPQSIIQEKPEIQPERVIQEEQPMEIEAEGGASAHLSREQMEEQAPIEPAVDPIMVDLGEVPTKDELLELSAHMRKLHASQDMSTLATVLELLHQHQKQHMKITKDGVMSFDMEHIHKSTYLRIRKVLSLPNQPVIIE